MQFNSSEKKSTENVTLAQRTRKRLSVQLGLPFGIFVVAVIFLLLVATYIVQDRASASTQVIPQSHADGIALRVEQGLEHSVAIGSIIARLSSAQIDAKNLEVIHTLIDSDRAILSVSFVDASLQMVWEIKTASSYPMKEMQMLALPTTVRFDDAEMGSSGYMQETVHFPVYGKSGEQIGVLMVTYDISVYWEILADYQFGDAYIIDKTGDVLLSRKTDGESTTTIASVPGVRNFVEKKRVVSEYKEEDGVAMSSAWSPIRLSGWAIVVEEPLAALYGQLDAMYAFIGFIFFIIIFLFVNEVIIVRTKIFAPLRSLSENAQRIAKGEQNSWVNTSANNEFDTVGETMNAMAHHVRMLRLGLEERIAERTEHLAAKTEEAERLNAFMVNRELRMRELKERVHHLEEELRMKENGTKEDDGGVH